MIAVGNTCLHGARLTLFKHLAVFWNRIFVVVIHSLQVGPQGIFHIMSVFPKTGRPTRNECKTLAVIDPCKAQEYQARV